MEGKKTELKYNKAYLRFKKIELKEDDDILFNPTIFGEIYKQQQERDNMLSNPPKLEEGLYKCKFCGSKETFSYGKQTRSADEPMTVFVTCGKCGKKWTINT